MCDYSFYLKMSEECNNSDTELDPRIQVELELLNTTTDEINKLELEYDVSHYYQKEICGITKLCSLLGSKYDVSYAVK